MLPVVLPGIVKAEAAHHSQPCWKIAYQTLQEAQIVGAKAELQEMPHLKCCLLLSLGS